jgi:hypothetical protein
MSGINNNNVGRIAERIVANELESLGFEVSELNREKTSANVDLLALSSSGKFWQLQVKGAANKEKEPWWVGYGHCTEAQIKDRNDPIFNRSATSIYRAEIVVLVAVRSPKHYRWIAMPIMEAGKAAQMNLDRDFRTPRLSGSPDPKKPGKVWLQLDHTPKRRTKDKNLANQLDSLLAQERDIVASYIDNWTVLGKP